MSTQKRMTSALSVYFKKRKKKKEKETKREKEKAPMNGSGTHLEKLDCSPCVVTYRCGLEAGGRSPLYTPHLCTHRSDYSKQVGAQFLRNRLKNSEKVWSVSGYFQLCENQRFSLGFRFQAH